MWTRVFLLLLTVGATGAALAIALIAALKKRRVPSVDRPASTHMQS